MVKKILAAVAAGCVGAAVLVPPAPARADEYSYFTELKASGIVVYDPALSLQGGYRICAWQEITGNGNVTASQVYEYYNRRDVDSWATAQLYVQIAVGNLCPWLWQYSIPVQPPLVRAS